MLTQISRVQFPDGGSLTARASAACPYDDVPVEYSGDVDRFPNRPGRCGVMVMRYLVKCFADQQGAVFGETFYGQFDASE